MGHYPIKCIHCMRTIKMYERTVRLEKENIQTFDDRFEKKLENGLDDLEILGSVRTNKKIEYKSITELIKDGVLVSTDTEDIPLSNEYANMEDLQDPLVKAVEVADLEINNEKISGKIKEFYCPHCKEKLIPLSGQMPMYLISLMGPSSAGKTVYLTILHAMLGGKIVRVPEGSLYFVTLGEVGREIQSFALKIQRKNELPPTTAELMKDPYLFQVTYMADANSQQRNKQCLLGIIDMRGELLLGGHNRELERHSVPQFKEADGFIMMVDPETLDGVYMRLPEEFLGNRTVEQLDGTINDMQEAIMNSITSDMGIITKPSVVSLVKQDLLLKYNVPLNIPINEAVIAPGFRMIPGTNLKRMYYDPMNYSTRNCIQYLSGGFTSFLDNTFKTPYYMSLSSLGPDVQIKGNMINSSGKIHPLRVVDPITKLLMDFNFLPKFYLEEYYTNRGAVMNYWGTHYAEYWPYATGGNGGNKGTPEEAEGGYDMAEEPAKKGLFGRKKKK